MKTTGLISKATSCVEPREMRGDHTNRFSDFSQKQLLSFFSLKTNISAGFDVMII
jgi:hypothetical protein